MSSGRPVFVHDGALDARWSRAAALKAMTENWAKWENAKEDYAHLRSLYLHDGMSKAEEGVALDRAASDERLKKAIKDTTYYRNETMAYAQIAQTLGAYI